MTPLIVAFAAFVGVAALVGSMALMFRSDGNARLEDRLSVITGAKSSRGSQDSAAAGMLASFEDQSSPFERLFSRFMNLSLLMQQADVQIAPTKFLTICGVLGAGAGAAVLFSGSHPGFLPFAVIGGALLPLLWLVFKRKSRLKKFGGQLPVALELVARALRAGHSLASGFKLVEQELALPLSREFGRVFEEQNLGMPLEDALKNMTERVPNLDLKFFVTSVILQRQTGGDLAEILDKIGHLIRERIQIWGQVQALTGEGRLSGIVLLALPPVLFVAVYRMNPDYMMTLFTDDMGKQMLVGGVISQIIGALVIRKIVNIKV